MELTTLCYPIKGDKVYLAVKKRGFGQGYLTGYGGKKQSSDLTMEEAAIRELREESGVTTYAQFLGNVAIIDFFKADQHIFECHVYFCHDWWDDFTETEEMAPPKVYDLHSPPYTLMWDADKDWLPLVFAGKKIRARVYYNSEMTELVGFEHEPL